MEIQDKALLNAYNVADERSKEMLRAMFPDFDFTVEEKDDRDITERVKTFEDACTELGLVADAVTAQWEAAGLTMPDEVAYQKLRIICAALNEGWQPKFTEDEVRWQPWFYLWTGDELAEKSEEWKRNYALIMTEGVYETEFAGFASAHSTCAPSHTVALFGSRLCLKSEAISDYCGRQFAALWADFYLIRKS